MENKIQKANLQLIDSYVKDSYMKIHKKLEKGQKDLQMDIEVKLSKIKALEDNTKLKANMLLIQEIKINDEENKEPIVEIGVQMLGSFVGVNLEENQFIEMMKYNGTPLLSQLIRSYVITMTSVGGMDPVRIPMINFIEFFKGDNK